MLAQVPGSILWVTLAEFRGVGAVETGAAALSPAPAVFPRTSTEPPGDLLPLPVAEFEAIRNRVSLERERCGVCGSQGVCWHGQCWLCSECAECADFCDADLRLTMQVVDVAGRQVLVRWRVEELTEWQSSWLHVGDSVNLADEVGMKLSPN